MKNNILVATLLLFLIQSCASTNHKQLANANDHIIGTFLFGGCFTNDTVSLSINNRPIFDSLTMTTSPLGGLSVVPYGEMIFYQDYIVFRQDTMRFNPFYGTKEINIVIKKNGVNHIFQRKQRNGLHFITSVCTADREKMYINQYKKLPELD